MRERENGEGGGGRKGGSEKRIRWGWKEGKWGRSRRRERKTVRRHERGQETRNR